MTVYPLTQILLYLALFFTPPDATRITIAGPDILMELARDKTGWTSGTARLSADGGQLTCEENSRRETTSVADFVKTALNHDWTGVTKIKLPESATLEKTSSGFVMRVNDGDPAQRAYTITYHRPATPAAAPRPLTINVLGAVNRPGAYSLPAGATLLDAIAAAGGGSPVAHLRKLSLVRGPAGEKPAVTSHDAEAILRGQAPNSALLDRDTVFIPERLL